VLGLSYKSVKLGNSLCGVHPGVSGCRPLTSLALREHDGGESPLLRIKGFIAGTSQRFLCLLRAHYLPPVQRGQAFLNKPLTSLALRAHEGSVPLPDT
jgi:hypothetical protein